MNENKVRYLIPSIVIILFIFLTIGLSPGSADVIGRNETLIENSEDIVSIAFNTEGGTDGEYGIYFFFDSQCGSCHEAIAYFEELAGKDAEFGISQYDLASNEEHKELYNSMKEAYNVTSLSYPSVFIGDVILEGSDTIRDQFLKLYDENQRLKDEMEEES
jgi:hypothetical protein